MDLLTQGILGAVAGQAAYGRRLGRKAALLGSLGGLAPDLDVIVGALTDPITGIVVHRGLTHSFWFPFLMGPVLGLLYWKWRQWRAGEDLSLQACIGAAFWGMVTHAPLDLFTFYGTQLLAPFSDKRFALNGVAIIDVFYTGILLAGMIWGLVSLARAQKIARWNLLVTTLYLFAGGLINETMTRELQAQHGPENRVWVAPTLFQPFYRRVVVHNREGMAVGHSHFLYPQDPISYCYRARSQDPRVRQLLETPEGRIFRWFADDLTYEWLEEGEGGQATAFVSDARISLSLDGAQPFWGISATFDATGTPLTPVRYFEAPAHLKREWSTAVTFLLRGCFYPLMKSWGL